MVLVLPKHKQPAYDLLSVAAGNLYELTSQRVLS